MRTFFGEFPRQCYLHIESEGSLEVTMAESRAREPFAVTTFRITSDQWRWLRQMALERASDRGFGKPDASEVLRELLDMHRDGT